MAGKKIGIVLALDGEKQFAQGVQNARKETASLKAEMKNLAAEYEGNANSMEYLQKKQDILTRQQEAYQNKLKQAQEGLNKANSNFHKQSARLVELQGELSKATKALGEMQRTGQEGSKEYEKQEKKVKELAEAVNKQTLARQKEAGAVSDWNRKIYESGSELKKANRAIENNAKYLEEAKISTDKCAKSIDEYGETVEKAQRIESTWAGAAKEGLMEALASKGLNAAAEALKAGVGAVKDSMVDLSSASTTLAAKTGLSETAMKKYSAVMKEVRGNNFGEDYSDISSVMAEIVQIMGEMDPSAMQETTEAAITLRDTFEMDVNETIRAADVMVKTMGIDASTVFDLIARGAQNGLNRSGELTDNLTEYSQIWGQAGFSAEEMFSILDNGLKSGAYNLDKVNDYVKEFGNSLADGRIEDNLSSFSTETQNLFLQWKNGQASTSDVFYSVIDDLEQMKNKQQALTLASDVWSALGEDNAMQVLTALNDVNDAYANTKGAMESLKEVRYSDLESAVSGLGAALQENITTPLAEAALPAITGAFETATGVINKIGEAITPQKTELETFIDEVQTSNEEVGKLLESANSVVNSAEIDISNLEAYKSTLLSINEIEQKDEFQKYQVRAAVEALSDSIPALKSAYDEQTGSISLTNEEISNLIENQERLIMQNAQMEAKETAYKALADAEINVAMASSAVKKAEEELNAARADKGNLIPMADGTYEYKDAVKELESTLWEAMGAEEKAAKTRDEAKTLVKDTEEALKTLNEEQGKAVDEQERQNNVIGDNTALRKLQNQSIKETTKAVEEESEAQKAAADTAQAAAAAQKEAAQAIADTYEDTRSKIESDLQNKISLFDMFDTSDGGEDLSVEQMTDNLNSQIEAFENYQKNLEAVKEHVGKEISPEFMQYLQDMGMEGANTLDHILQTFADEEPEKVRELNDRWMEAMDQSEVIAKAGAANKTAYELAMGEMGSSGADFSELSDSIDAAVSSAAEGWSGLPAATKTALDEAVQTAKDCGIKIPEGLTEGITSGEVSPEEAIAQLNGSIQGTFDGLAEIAKEQGITIPEELSAGIASGGQAASDALSSLISKITEQAATAKEAGETVGSETASGAQSSIAEGTPGVEQASSDMASAGAAAADGKSTDFYGAGAKSASEYLRALQEAKAKATTAGAELAAATKAAVASQTGFYAAGVNMAAGVASGISDGASRAIAAARSMAASALAAAKAELEIHSPSKKFKDQVGAQISTGTAFGIKDKASLAGKAAKQMSNKVYTNAVSWLSKYKKSQQVSLSDEKWYWQQVLKHTKSGTTAYKNALKKIQNITKSELTASGLSSSVASKVVGNFGVSKTTGTGKKKKNKDTETYYSEVYSAAQKYLSNQQALNDWSLQQELAYWKGVKGQLKSGTQAWYDATKQINSLQADIAAAEAKAAEEKIRVHASVQSDILSKYKTYYKVSAKAEADYWNAARKQFRTGTDERIEADQKYFEALQSLYEQRKELDEDYAENSKEINEQLQEDIQDLQDAYKDAVKSRKEDILSQMDLFEAWDSTGYDADTLLHNLKTQVAGLALWEQQLEELEKKKLSAGLLQELKEMGPDAAASIYSLNQMTAAQLEEYNRLWEQKNDLAQSQAIKDNESLRLDTNKEITQLRLDAQSELNALNADYRAAIAELYNGMSGDLANLINRAGSIGEEAVSSLIGSIGKAANSVDTYNSTTQVVGTVSAQLSALQQEGKVIGKGTLDGLLEGMQDQNKINAASKKVIQSIKRAMEEEAEIHSPSRLFRRETGPQIPAGVALGMEDGTAAAVKTSKNTIREMLTAAQEEMQRKQAALQSEAEKLDYSGIARLNRLTEAAVSQAPVVNINNDGLAALIGTLIGTVNGLSEKMDHLQVVMDSGALVGEIQPAMSQANADATIRRNRGRMR